MAVTSICNLDFSCFIFMGPSTGVLFTYNALIHRLYLIQCQLSSDLYIERELFTYSLITTGKTLISRTFLSCILTVVRTAIQMCTVASTLYIDPYRTGSSPRFLCSVTPVWQRSIVGDVPTRTNVSSFKSVIRLWIHVCVTIVLSNIAVGFVIHCLTEHCTNFLEDKDG